VQLRNLYHSKSTIPAVQQRQRKTQQPSRKYNRHNFKLCRYLANIIRYSQIEEIKKCDGSMGRVLRGRVPRGFLQMPLSLAAQAAVIASILSLYLGLCMAVTCPCTPQTWLRALSSSAASHMKAQRNHSPAFIIASKTAAPSSSLPFSEGCTVSSHSSAYFGP